MNQEEIQAKARELCEKYGEPVVVELQSLAWPKKGTESQSWRVHVVGDGHRSVSESGDDFATLEAAIAKALDPANKSAATLALAEKLEREAAELRASLPKAEVTL